MQLNSTSKRADQLQFLRFLAFCLIFLHHIEWAPLGFPTPNGSGLAVSFFFLLSGFVSAYTRYGKCEPLRWYSPFTYLWKKYKKVWPLHLLTLGIALLLSNVPAAFTAKDNVWLAPQLTALWHNILLIQSWCKDTYYYYNGVSWFLSSIMFSYLLTLPVSALLNRLNQKKHPVPVFCAFLVLLSGCIVGWCYYTRNMEISFLQYIHPAARALEYLMGMVLCHITLSLKDRISSEKGVTAIFTVFELLALGVWVIYLYLPHDIQWLFFTARWLIPNLLLLFVFGFGFGKVSAVFRWKPLKRLGDISFECFLIHQIVIRIYLLFNAQIVTPGIRERLFCAISCFAITVGMALLINKKPAPNRI